MSNYIPKKIKRQVAERANFCCEYCLSQVSFSPDSFVIEHIIPTILNGTDELDNLAYSCQGCNNHKFTSIEAIDLVTGQQVSLFNPRIHKRENHFKWNDNFTIIIGLSATGRATIQKLQLNREGVVNLREILTAAGKHPPF